MTEYKRVKVRNLQAGDKVSDYSFTTVRRVYEYSGLLDGKMSPVIEFETGLKVFPSSMDEEVEVEKGKQK